MVAFGGQTTKLLAFTLHGDISPKFSIDHGSEISDRIRKKLGGGVKKIGRTGLLYHRDKFDGDRTSHSEKVWCFLFDL